MDPDCATAAASDVFSLLEASGFPFNRTMLMLISILKNIAQYKEMQIGNLSRYHHHDLTH